MAKRVTASGPIEGPWALPDGWHWERLGNVANRIADKHIPDPNSTLPFVGMDAIAPHSMKAGASQPFREMRSAASAFQPGDVLYGRLRPYLNKVWYATFAGACSGELIVIRPSIELEARYLAFLLHSDAFVEFASHAVSGDRPRIDFGTMGDYPVPVPATDVQRRIVARIDELLAEIDDGEAALARARDDLVIWRKALLKAAVTGELTADWRDSHPPAETGAELMARILADRRARWGMEPRNARKKYAEPNGIDIDPSETVPAGWAIASIEQVAFVENGQTPKGIDAAVGTTGDIPWFKVSSMNAPGNVDLLTESKWWLSAASVARLGLRLHPAGSIVFPKRGGSIYTEKKRRLGRPGSIDLNVMAVVPLNGAAGHLWTFFRNLSLRAISDGSNVPQINYNDVAQLRIMLPPSEEAQEISARVEGALAITSEVEADIDQLLFDAKVLRQSILAAAFRGELA